MMFPPAATWTRAVGLRGQLIIILVISYTLNGLLILNTPIILPTFKNTLLAIKLFLNLLPILEI